MQRKTATEPDEVHQEQVSRPFRAEHTGRGGRGRGENTGGKGRERGNQTLINSWKCLASTMRTGFSYFNIFF